MAVVNLCIKHKNKFNPVVCLLDEVRSYCPNVWGLDALHFFIQWETLNVKPKNKSSEGAWKITESWI